MGTTIRRGSAALLLGVVLGGCTAWAAPAATQPPPATPVLTPYPSSLPMPTPSPESVGVAALLANAVETTMAAGTATIAMDIQAPSALTGSPATAMHIDGAMGLGEHASGRFEMDTAGLGIDGTITMILDQDVLYVRLHGAIGQVLNAEDQWFRLDDSSTGGFARSMRPFLASSNDSLLALYYLLAPGDDARIVDTGTTHGVPTTQVAATVDLGAALDQVQGTLRDSMAVAIWTLKSSGMKPVASAQAWIDDTGLVHRLRLSMPGPTAGSMVIVLDLSKHGAPLDLGVPDPSQVRPADELPFPGG